MTKREPFALSRGKRRGAVLRILEKTAVKKALALLFQLALGFTMGSVRLLGECGPFGVGLVAVSGGQFGGFLTLVGTSAGYLISGGFDWGIRYVAAAVLTFTAAFVFQDTRLVRLRWFMPAVTVLIMGCTELLNSFEAASELPAVILGSTEMIFAGGSAYFFGVALSPMPTETETEERRRTVSFLLLLSCVLMAFSEFSVLRVLSLGRVAALLIVMTAAYKGGSALGSLTGTVFGLAMDLTAAQTPIFTMAYAFAGLLSGLFARHGKLAFLLSFVLSSAAAVLWTWGGALRVELLYEGFTASVIFLLLPASTLEKFGAVFDTSAIGAGEAGLRSFEALRVRQMGEAFRELYETVRGSVQSSGNENDIAIVFDRAADSVCVHCKNAAACWQRDYVSTLDAMNCATKAMTERGKLLREDLPEYFLEKCPNSYAFISAVNGELRGVLYRRQFRARLGENRSVAWAQFSDLSAVLLRLADELGGTAGADALAERRLTRYLRGQDIEARVSVFRDAGGRLRAVIESGRLAKLENEEALTKLSSVVGVRLCRPADCQYEGRMTLLEAEPLAVSVGIASARKKGESVSGDKGTYFKTEEGKLCILLSDGMGSGLEAAKESAAALKILERFLRAGLEPQTAMKLLNSVLLLRGGGDDWGCAAVDLVCVDLFSGETVFYKYGAAPSYVKNGRAIRRVQGESMAAGLCSGEGTAPDQMRLRLKPGSLALIASDGVLPEEDDLWLKSLLTEFQGNDVKQLAREAVQAAIRQYGCEDDMTVLAVCVEKRP